ncbi:orexin receptor type 2 [Elysia marginata]|uniref:Orexin receptor type 2 n=1 Tax=Elysia marginata TaxID=1093978 RepID=A0AAV4HJC8_9GAST|nr:orexin receptor type 2 [Elysia marginata]
MLFDCSPSPICPSTLSLNPNDLRGVVIGLSLKWVLDLFRGVFQRLMLIMDGDEKENESEGRVFYYSHYQDLGLEDSTPIPLLNTTSFTQSVLSAYLREFNERKSKNFYPIYIFLGCVLVLGVLANLLVCCIYRCRARRAASNFLVIFFAACDLAGCLLAVPSVLVVIALPYRYDVAFFCKLTGYVETCCVCSLCFTLLCAAYICHRQLCGNGLSVCRARYGCAGALSVSVLVSIPAMVVYNVNAVQTTYWPHVEGHECGLDAAVQPWLVHLHHAMVLSCVTLVFIVMGLLYGLIFVSWFKQRQAQCRGDKPSPALKQFPKKHRFVREDTSSSSVTAGSYSEEIGRLHTARTQCHTSAPHHHFQLNHHHYHHHHQHTDPVRVPLRNGYDGGTGGRTTMGTYERSGGRGIVKSASHGMMKNSNSGHTNLLDSTNPSALTTTTATTVSPVIQLHVNNTKQASIFLVISIVFVICMLPYVVVTVLIATTNVFQRFSSNATEIVVKFCLRSYLLNYLVKPVVYFIFNVNFREEVKQFFLKFRDLLCAPKTPTGRPSPPQSETTACSTPRTQHREMRSLSSSSIYRPAKASV